jgi:hypothetical protein
MVVLVWLPVHHTLCDDARLPASAVSRRDTLVSIVRPALQVQDRVFSFLNGQGRGARGKRISRASTYRGADGSLDLRRDGHETDHSA